MKQKDKDIQNKNIRILLIDDEDDSSKFHDYSIKWESSIQAGKTALFSEIFDLCFLSGEFENNAALELLREAKIENCTTPIIVYTKNNDLEIDLKSMELGAADYFVKDELTPSVLEKSIRYSIRRAKTLELLKEQEIQVVMQDRFASIGLLALNLAHEIGTPLGVIRGRAEFLGLQRKDDSFLIKNLDTIISQTDCVSHLIKSLLNLSKISPNKSSSNATLQDLIAETIELLGHEFKKNNINLINEFETLPLIMVSAESSKFQQVMFNILINAVQAIESSIKQGQLNAHFIRIAFQQENDFYHVSIEDSGCGIPEKNIRNLFKPFFTTRDIGKGVGLGLAISHRIVESWGGKITVVTKEHEGTKFSIHIPSLVSKS